jgi:hypothetical protein
VKTGEVTKSPLLPQNTHVARRFTYIIPAAAVLFLTASLIGQVGEITIS